MELPQDETFRRQASRYGLRWNCEDCAWFDRAGRCALGYPAERHRRARYRDPAASLLFCKEFELR